MIESEPGAMLHERLDRLVDLPVQPHHVSACAQGDPQQVYGGKRFGCHVPSLAGAHHGRRRRCAA
jgi:hypothetical protein